MHDRQCALNRDVAELIPIISGVVNKSKTIELCISPVYRRLAVAKVTKFTMLKLLTTDRITFPVNTRGN